MNVREFSTYFAVFSSYFGALTIIFIVGFPSPTQKQLIEENILSHETLPIFAAIPHVAILIGVFTAPLLVQFGFHLKTAATVSCVLGVAGFELIILADSATYLYIGETLVACYTGIMSIFLLTYISDVTLDSQRRLMSGGYGFCLRIGLLIVYFAGIWLSFRWLAVFGLFQICIFYFLMVINPISPVWYIKQGLDDRAKSILLYLHGNDFDAEAEISKIQHETLSNQVNWVENFNALKDWKVFKPMILMAIIACLKELGGHNAMVSFSSHILESQQAMDPKVAALFYPIFLIVGAVVCLFIMNCCKLKWLMIIASVFQGSSHISMAIYYAFSENYLHCNLESSQICFIISFWPITNIAIFAFSFGFGWGLVHFSLMGIMFTTCRGIFTAMTSVITNLTSSFVIYIFFYLLSKIGGFATFLIFASNYLIAIVFLFFFIDF